MIIWLGFTGLVFFSLIYSRICNIELRYFLYFFIFFTITYFSAFRNGLGQDYSNYVDVIKYAQLEFTFKEPGYYLLVEFIRKFDLSEVVFFIFFSITTNAFILITYTKSRSFYFSVLIYIFLPVLFFNTFNVVRQWCSAAIIVYGFKYIVESNLLKYSLCVLLGAFFHLSAFVMLPFYYLLQIKLSSSFYLICVFLSFLIGTVISPDFSSVLGEYINIYSHYFSEDEKVQGSNLLGLSFNLIFVYFCLNKNKLKLDKFSNLYFNAFFILVLLYNFIPSFFYLYRLTIYFLAALPLALCLPCGRLRNWRLYSTFILFIYFLLFIFFLMSNLDNSKVIPDSIYFFGDL